jgi:Ser/Thr protein kinase RdoA (MazF antagonist)
MRRIAWHSPRPFAASGIVDCAGGTVFVKCHDAQVRTVSDLAEEHAFIAHLRAAGCAVPCVMTTRDGASAVIGPAGTYEVHALATGEDRYRDAPSWTPLADLDEARQAGAALGRLHRAAAGYDAPARRTRLVVAGDWLLRALDPATAFAEWAAGDPLLRAALDGRPWRADFTRVLQKLYRAASGVFAAPLWAHGDFHASNLLWGTEGVTAVLDFGLCNRASAVYDLATCVERNAISWLRLSRGERDIGHADIAAALIEGYVRHAVLPAGLRAVLPVVHVEFALTELSYFHAVTGDAAHAEQAYSDFLLGHAAWFAGEAGQDFLARLA